MSEKNLTRIRTQVKNKSSQMSNALADVAKLVSCFVVVRTIYLSQIWTSRMR